MSNNNKIYLGKVPIVIKNRKCEQNFPRLKYLRLISNVSLLIHYLTNLKKSIVFNKKV